MSVTKYFIRPMLDEDIPQALDIDHEAFSTQWPPLSYGSLKQELRNRLAHYIVLCTREDRPPPAGGPGESEPGDVIHPGVWDHIRNFFQRDHQSSEAGRIVPSMLDTVVSFASIWKMMDEGHLISIATRKEYRGKGCGEMLLIAVIQTCFELGAHVVTLEVRISNKVAQALYVKYGFRSAGVRHAYYSDNNEDALIMTTDNITSESFQEWFRKLRKAHAERWPYLYERVPEAVR